MRRKRLTSLKETDAFQQQTAWEPSKLSKSGPGGKASAKTLGVQAKMERLRLRRYLRKQQPAVLFHDSSQFSSCGMSRLSIFRLKSPPCNRRVLFWRSQNHGGSSYKPGCSYTHELQTQRVDTTTRRRTLCTMFELDIHAITCESPNSS